jgi:hypothetical protein
MLNMYWTCQACFCAYILHLNSSPTVLKIRILGPSVRTENFGLGPQPCLPTKRHTNHSGMLLLIVAAQSKETLTVME